MHIQHYLARSGWSLLPLNWHVVQNIEHQNYEHPVCTCTFLFVAGSSLCCVNICIATRASSPCFLTSSPATWCWAGTVGRPRGPGSAPNSPFVPGWTTAVSSPIPWRNLVSCVVVNTLVFICEAVGAGGFSTPWTPRAVNNRHCPVPCAVCTTNKCHILYWRTQPNVLTLFIAREYASHPR